MKGNNEDVNDNTTSSNEVYLPNGYFTPFSSSESNYQEQATTEGPEGPPTPIDDWIPVFVLLGITIAGRHYFHIKIKS